MSLLHQTLQDLTKSSKFPLDNFTIADFGCSSRPQPLLIVSEITSTVYKTCRELNRTCPEFWIYINEFSGFDFNSMFKSWSDHHSGQNGSDFKSLLYISGVPGSSMERLFPSKSLNFVHSSFSLNWLSQVPLELRDGANRVMARPEVMEACRAQFRRDFRSFLESRSEEVVTGGQMVLTLIGRRKADEERCSVMDCVGQAFQDLVDKELLDWTRLDFNHVYHYEPCKEEIEDEITKQASFELDHLVINSIPWCDTMLVYGKKNQSKAIIAQMISNKVEIEESLVQKFSEGVAAKLKKVELVEIAVCVTKK